MLFDAAALERAGADAIARLTEAAAAAVRRLPG
jgi:hypothetical protein